MEQALRDRLLKAFETDDFDDVREGLLYSDKKPAYKGHPQRHRWWVDVFTVIEVTPGFFVGFWDAMTTGDDSPSDKGWEFDPETIREVEPYEEVVTLTKYRDKPKAGS